MERLKWIEIYANPEFYIDLEIAGHKVGIYFLILIAFTEAGFFTGLLFSSDGFLFVAGMYSSLLINQLLTIHNENIGVLVLSGLIAGASILGNILAYGYGSKAEVYFYQKKDGILYKRKYLEKSKLFFEKYGVWAIIFAHFIPLVRIFIPVLSAVSATRFRRFAALVTISSTIWSFSIILFSHYLYKFLLVNYDLDLRQHLWLIVLILIIVALVFVVSRFVYKRFSTALSGR